MAADGAFTGTWGRVSNEIGSTIDNTDEAKSITRAIESGAGSGNVKVDAFRKLFEDVLVAFETSTGKQVKRRANYVPHVWNRYGRNILANNDEIANDLSRIFVTVSEVGESGFIQQRRIKAGEYTIAGKKVKFATGTAEDINETLKRSFPGQITKDVMETDIRVIADAYINSMGRGVGGEALLANLKKMGVSVDGDEAMTLVKDVAGTKAANSAAAKEFKEQLTKSKEATKTLQRNAAESSKLAAQTVRDTLKSRLGLQRKTRIAMQQRSNELFGKIANENISMDAKISELNSEILSASDELAKANERLASRTVELQNDIAQYGDDLRNMRKDRVAKRAQLQKEVEELADEVQEIKTTIDSYNDLYEVVQSLKDDLDNKLKEFDVDDLIPENAKKTLTKRTEAQQKQLDDYSKQALDAEGIGEGVEEVTRVVRLGTQGNVSYSLAKRLNMDPNTTSPMLRQAIDSVGSIMDDATNTEIERITELINRIHGVSSVTESDVVRAQKIVDKINRDYLRKKADVDIRRANPAGQKDPNTGRTVTNPQKTLESHESSLRQIEERLKRAQDNLESVKRLEMESSVRSQFGFRPEYPEIQKAEDQIAIIDSEITKRKAQLANAASRGEKGAGSYAAVQKEIKELESARVQINRLRNQASTRLTERELAEQTISQRQRQLAADIASVAANVYTKTLQQTGSDIAARDMKELIETLAKAIETKVSTRNAPGAGRALQRTMQLNLEDAYIRARISLDFGTRMRLIDAELDAIGQTLTSGEREVVKDAVMSGVLTSERSNLSQQRSTLFNQLMNYRSGKRVGEDYAIAKTRASIAAEDRVNQTWGIVRLYIDEIKQAQMDVLETARYLQDDAGNILTSPGVYDSPSSMIYDTRGLDEILDETVKQGYSIIANNSVRKEAFEALERTKKELQEQIALIVYGGDVAGAKAYAKTDAFKKLMKSLSVRDDAGSRKALSDEISRVQLNIEAKALGKESAGDVVKSTRKATAAEKLVQKEIQIVDDKMSQYDRLINYLSVSAPATRTKTGKLTAEAERQIARLSEQAQKLREEAAAVGGRSEAGKRARSTAGLLEESIKRIEKYGIRPRSKRITADDILAGNLKIQYSKIRGMDEIGRLSDEIANAESQINDVLTKGELAYLNLGRAVKGVDAPAEDVIERGKKYLKAIDEELDKLKNRESTMAQNDNAVKDIKAYRASLQSEQKKLTKMLKQSTPLENRLSVPRFKMLNKLQEIQNLKIKSQLEVEMSATLSRLREELRAVELSNTNATELNEALARARTNWAEMMMGGIRENYDATVGALRNDAASVEASRAAIESWIPLVEDVLRRIPKLNKAGKSENINEIFEWVQEAYAMIDPDGYVQRTANLADDLTPDIIADTTQLYGMGMKNSDIMRALSTLPDSAETRKSLALLMRAHKDAAELIAAESKRAPLEEMLKTAKDGEFVTVLKTALKDGFIEIGENSNVFVAEEMAPLLSRVMELKPSDAKGLIGAINKYTEVWKAIKTTSPRFHIRNAMSATIMNYVSGVSTRNMIRGVDVWRAFTKNPLGWLNDIDPALRPYAKRALDAVFAGGGGQYQEIANAATAISKKGLFRVSRNAGTNVEGAIRMGQALDAMLPAELGGKGLGFDQAVGRIEKFHFNYSKLSKFDEQARAFIPFWIFMSRNLPLQLEQMWLSPRTYAIYNSLARNLDDGEEGDIVPEWIKEGGGFKLPVGGGLYAIPDIGYTQVQRDLKMLEDPMRLGQNLNPVLKTALEYWAGKQFYQDIPLSGEEFVPVRGAARLAEPVLALANLLGVGEGVQSSGGQRVATQKDLYAALALIPGLQEIERYIAPSTERAQERQALNVASFFTGAPVTTVGERQINAELLRRRFEEADRRRREQAIFRGGFE
jgi:chromosome segregation ATPase